MDEVGLPNSHAFTHPRNCLPLSLFAPTLDLFDRWMNKFSPTSTILRDPNTGKFTNEAVDFDFGDLVTMTIIDVFETDVNGKLLSYCPTFDNRAVHKTPEMAERIRKGASHLMERVEDVVNSPAGKSVNQVGNSISIRVDLISSILYAS